MTEEIYPDIFKLEIPLPNNPLRALNSYIIKSEGRSLIVDTGFNTEEGRQILWAGLEETGASLGSTDLLVTHHHADHTGLSAALSREGAIVYSGETDGRMINEMTGLKEWTKLDGFIKIFGLEKDKVSFIDHPGYRYCPKEPVEFRFVREGDRIAVGQYSFEIIDIPGHTPGHIGLYESKHKLFFCGDHILDKITPNIAFWGFDQDILAVYFDSLRKIREYDIDYLLTAHRNIIRDHKRRIDELLVHYKKRLEEVEEIIRNGPVTVRDTAASMHWEIKCSNWKDFPKPQKWFASSEAMSHLEHLYCKGRAERWTVEGVLQYKLK